ncbi:MAG: aminotransferase class V-fold PLP-dependent enzyme [Actinomycetales bacterium]
MAETVGVAPSAQTVTTPRVGGPQGYDVRRVREDFPILNRTMAGGRPLVYLDSANTSQKPTAVIDAMAAHLAGHNANVARAMHQLGAEATTAFEDARTAVARFIGAPRREEVIFTKNASEALNLVARALGDLGQPGTGSVPGVNLSPLGPGDEVLITEMEHHSNIVPWQQLCQRTGATLKWIGVTDSGRLDLEGSAEVHHLHKQPLDTLITERTRVVSVAWVSNALGTVNPVAQIAARAKQVGAFVVVDASQAVPQLPVDVSALGADFVAFTGHKMVGPTGIGVLWGRYDLLAALPPFLGGGEMIARVTMAGSTYAEPPHRFEAGTPPIVEAVGLGAAVRYLENLGMDAVAEHERQITGYALQRLLEVPGLSVMGPTDLDADGLPIERGGAISFELTDRDGGQIHPHDVAQVLDSLGVAVRAGHHCAAPVHQRFGVQSSTRASFYLYTTPEEIDALVDSLGQVRQFFGG